MTVAKGLLGSFFTVACSVCQLLMSELHSIRNFTCLTLANISSSYSLILVLGFIWKTPRKTFNFDLNSQTMSHQIHKYFIYFSSLAITTDVQVTFKGGLLLCYACLCVWVCLVFLWKIDCLILVPVVRLADVKSVFLCLHLFVISFVLILGLTVMRGGVKRMGGGRRHRGGTWVSETSGLIYEN